MTTTEPDTTPVEALDFEPACDCACHDGCGATAQWIVRWHPPCGCKIIRLLCQQCLDLARKEWPLTVKWLCPANHVMHGRAKDWVHVEPIKP